MSRYWSDVTKGLTPYVPGEQPKVANGLPKLVKLNTNKNPYPPSPRVSQAIQAELGETGNNFRRYPDPNSEAVKAAIKKVEDDKTGYDDGHLFYKEIQIFSW